MLGGFGKCVLNEHSLIVGPVSMLCPHSGPPFPEAVVSVLRHPLFFNHLTSSCLERGTWDRTRYFGNDMQTTFPASGTRILGRFLAQRSGGCRWMRHRQCPPDLIKLLLAAPIGQKAVMAHPHQTLGKNVLQKTARSTIPASVHPAHCRLLPGGSPVTTHRWRPPVSRLTSSGRETVLTGP